jgi:hypothetical protein
MYFELWDTETRNLLYDFETLDEALDAARTLAAPNVGVYPAKMALARVDDDTKTTWLAVGESLQPLLQEPDRRTA